MKQLSADKEGQCVCVRERERACLIDTLLFMRLFIPTLSHDSGAGSNFTVCYHGDALPEL